MTMASNGKASPWDPGAAFNRSMILYAEHSFNASTFTARVVTSTLSDLYSAVVGAKKFQPRWRTSEARLNGS